MFAGKIWRVGFVWALLCFLTGCAGTNFVRPPTEALKNGQTTIQQARAQFGKPYRESTSVINNESVTTLTYAFAASTGEALESGVLPARSMALMFWKDILVGNTFTSSFKEDATDFDNSKIVSIVKGVTTKEQIIALLGKPAGQSIYPEVSEKNGYGLTYQYVAMHGKTPFTQHLAQKLLVVTFDERGIVKDFTYTMTQ